MILETTTTEDKLPRIWLQLLNGKLKLTEKELEFVSSIITLYIQYSRQGLIEPFLSKIVFSADSRKDICDTIGGLSAQNFNNRLKQLIDKRILILKDGNYSLEPSLMPQSEVIFRFRVVPPKQKEDDKSGESI
jgi:hypothetical protein